MITIDHLRLQKVGAGWSLAMWMEASIGVTWSECFIEVQSSGECPNLMQCGVTQWRLVQCSVVKCSVVQCIVVQCSLVQCSVVQFSVVQCSGQQIPRCYANLFTAWTELGKVAVWGYFRSIWTLAYFFFLKDI